MDVYATAVDNNVWRLMTRAVCRMTQLLIVWRSAEGDCDFAALGVSKSVVFLVCFFAQSTSTVMSGPRLGEGIVDIQLSHVYRWDII